MGFRVCRVQKVCPTASPSVVFSTVYHGLEFFSNYEGKKAHKHKLFALVRVWLTLGQPAG